MKNILFVQPKLSGIGGIEKVVPEVAEYLSENDYQVSAFVLYGYIPDTQKFWIKSKSLAEEESKNIFHKIFKIIARLFHLKAFLIKDKTDVIIVSAQGISIIVLLGKYLKVIKTPVILYIHEKLTVSGKLYLFLIRQLYPKADGFISVSKGIKKELEETLPINKDTSVLAYNCLPKNFGQTTEEATLNYQQPVFITASRLEKIKGVDILVDNFVVFAEKNQGTLVILGEGSLEAELKGKVKKAGLEQRIVFFGSVTNVPSYLKKATAYVSIAREESLGLSLLESLACKIPVIAADVPYGPREIMNFAGDNTKYPALTPYGFLLENPSQVSANNFYQQFEKSLLEVQNINFDKSDFEERVNFFSVEKQLIGVESLLNKVFFKK